MSKKTIPEIQSLIREICRQQIKLTAYLSTLNDELSRRKATRKAPVRSKKVTVVLKLKIKNYAKENPSYSLQKIANKFKVNPGRVSEILSGKRSG